MTGPIALVVTDLDGTLWEEPTRVHPRAVAAVQQLEALGVPLLVATGRRIASTRAPLAAMGMAPPAVVLNGAVGLELDTGRRFHQSGFVGDDARAVLAAFAAWGAHPCVYVNRDDPSVWVNHTPSTHADHLASLGEDLGRGDLTEIVDAEQVLAFAILGMDGDVAAGIAAEVGDLARTHVDRDRQYRGTSLTVAPANQSKWDGVLAFCADRGLDPEAVLAIGDGPNDVELLDGAAVAVVPADGHPAALERADHVVGRAHDGGWADLVELVAPA